MTRYHRGSGLSGQNLLRQIRPAQTTDPHHHTFLADHLAHRMDVPSGHLFAILGSSDVETLRTVYHQMIGAQMGREILYGFAKAPGGYHRQDQVTGLGQLTAVVRSPYPIVQPGTLALAILVHPAYRFCISAIDQYLAPLADDVRHGGAETSGADNTDGWGHTAIIFGKVNGIMWVGGIL